MKIKFKYGAIVILLVTSIFITAIWITGSFLIEPNNQPIGDLPKDLIGYSVQFPSSSGTILHGWLITGRKGTGAIVLMHGVHANRLSMLDRARFLSQAGYSILLFDFQSHGESIGKHITFGYLESKDAQAAIEFLQQTLPNEKIGVIGVSMGGAAALLAVPPLKVNGMVLESVYPTIDQAVYDRLTMRFGKLGGGLTPLLTWQLKLRLGISVNDLRPIDKVKDITVPKLFLAGTDDQHTTLAESEQIFHAAAEPKDFWILQGAAHVDLYSFAKEAYEKRVLEFFDEYLH